jgi:hypothetical protein
VSGRKYDGDKAPIAQGVLAYFPDAIAMLAMISKFGKDKYETSYEERNWAHVEDGENRYLDAAARHVTKCASGEINDDESSLDHRGHAAWCLLASLQLAIEDERKEKHVPLHIDGKDVEWVVYDEVPQFQVGDTVKFTMTQDEHSRLTKGCKEFYTGEEFGQVGLAVNMRGVCGQYGKVTKVRDTYCQVDFPPGGSFRVWYIPNTHLAKAVDFGRTDVGM